jgi:hypothetical protein
MLLEAATKTMSRGKIGEQVYVTWEKNTIEKKAQCCNSSAIGYEWSSTVDSSECSNWTHIG